MTEQQVEIALKAFIKNFPIVLLCSVLITVLMALYFSFAGGASMASVPHAIKWFTLASHKIFGAGILLYTIVACALLIKNRASIVSFMIAAVVCGGLNEVAVLAFLPHGNAIVHAVVVIALSALLALLHWIFLTKIFVPGRFAKKDKTNA